MESNKRVSFGVIDFIIIICIVASCALFGYYAGQYLRKSSMANKNVLEYTIKFENLSLVNANLLAMGDNVSEAVHAVPAGKIVNVEKQPFTYLYENHVTGNYDYKTDDERHTVYITVQTPYKEDEKNFLVGGYILKIGDHMQIMTDRISLTGVISDINPK